MGEWDLVAFEKAATPERKYSAVLKDKFTGRVATVSFGRPGYWHFKDTTGLGLYSNLDHLKEDRRQRVRAKYAGDLTPQMYDPQYFSLNYLW